MALALLAAVSACKVSSKRATVAPGAARAATAQQDAETRQENVVEPGNAPPPWAADAPRPDPEARRLFLARAGQPPAAALAPAARLPRVTALALTNTARGEADGMRAEGGVTSAKLAEGERASVPVSIAPGECATFIAQGGLGVVELDAFLTASGASGKVLAEDPSSGPIAVIGGRGACFANTGRAPLAAELHVQARRGGGPVLVQGYRRAGRPALPAAAPRREAPVTPAAPAAPGRSAPGKPATPPTEDKPAPNDRPDASAAPTGARQAAAAT